MVIILVGTTTAHYGCEAKKRRISPIKGSVPESRILYDETRKAAEFRDRSSHKPSKCLSINTKATVRPCCGGWTAFPISAIQHNRPRPRRRNLETGARSERPRQPGLHPDPGGDCPNVANHPAPNAHSAARTMTSAPTAATLALFEGIEMSPQPFMHSGYCIIRPQPMSVWLMIPTT